MMLDNQHIKVSLFNPTSVKSKADAIVDYLVANNVDVLHCMTETWLTHNDIVAAGNITSQGYALYLLLSLYHVLRFGRAWWQHLCSLQIGVLSLG